MSVTTPTRAGQAELEAAQLLLERMGIHPTSCSRRRNRVGRRRRSPSTSRSWRGRSDRAPAACTARTGTGCVTGGASGPSTSPRRRRSSWSHAVARAYAGHTDSGGEAGATHTYVRATVQEVADRAGRPDRRAPSPRGTIMIRPTPPVLPTVTACGVRRARAAEAGRRGTSPATRVHRRAASGTVRRNPPMETTYFDDRTRTSTAAADRLRDEVRPATAATAFTDQLRSAARELPTPGVDVHGQQPWVAHTSPAGYQRARRTERPGRCSMRPAAGAVAGQPAGTENRAVLRSTAERTPRTRDRGRGLADARADRADRG